MRRNTSERRKNGLSLYAIIFSCLLFPLLFPRETPAHEDMASRPSVKAFRIDTPPVMDGRLDEPFWREADAATEFYQRNPNMGEPATFPVSVRIACDAKTVYIGFEIHSGDPAGLVSTVLQRDGSLNAYDDHFGFRFDTFHDHRDLYYFYINPKGTRLDGHATDEGVVSDNNWDGIWEVKTTIMPDGWMGEIALPVYNFRFKDLEEQTWGFACLVYVSATQENISWPNMERQTRKPSLFGHITGLDGLESDRPFVFTPYALAGAKIGRYTISPSNPREWNSVDDEWEYDAGLDIRYRPLPSLEANIALNPDFATVEADQFLFNLTVDELQYPEKRPFFTEGQARFETPIRLLYTRRIGLGGDEVIAGGKMHGRAGAYDFGFMDVVTGDGLDAACNYSALRVKRDILRSSTVGLLAVGKNETGPGFQGVNQAAGLDLNLQLGSASRVVGQFAVSSRPDAGTSGHAGVLSYNYSYPLFDPRDTFSWSTSFQLASDDFNLGDIGYFGRTSLDRRGVNNSVGYSFWIKKRGINRVQFNQRAWYFQDHAGDRKVQDGLSAEFSVETISLLRPGILLEKSYYLLPDGGYDNTQRTVSLTIGPYPRFRSELSWRTGDNFGSVIRYFDSEVIVKPSGRMRITMNYSNLRRDPFDAPAESTINNIARVGFNYLFIPDLYLRVFLQSDSQDELALVNSLLRWEYRPGSVFYLSYKETRDDSFDDFRTTDRQLLAKISYHLHR